MSDREIGIHGLEKGVAQTRPTSDRHKYEEKAISSFDLPVHEDSGLIFDTGLLSWLQVLGSFLLFFNSW